ncbi:hypothetical protein [Pseudomonas chlororaphis]|uniref:hypothetical protein n=1 Tax=Pseudomonas chlororaphis TaxID=587753 RepID=UPI00056B3078|nr:hypothetical protein [Pseudomonas chlororaphis]
MENWILAGLGIAASCLIAWVVYTVQKRDAKVLEALANLLKEQQAALIEMQQMHEHLSHHIKEQLEDFVLTKELPAFFDSDVALNLTPNFSVVDPDIPRLGEVILDRNIVRAGDSIEVLFRVDDDKWNFPVPDGATVLHEGGALIAEPTSGKYMSLNIVIPASAKNAHNLEFLLVDQGGKENRQIVSIPLH